MTRRLRTLLLVAAVGTSMTAVANAQSGADSSEEPLIDYDPLSKDWQGLSRWSALCNGSGLPVTAVASLEWNELDAQDVLVVMYPLSRVEPDKLEAFITAGGYAIIADDFGDSADALARLGLLRADAGAPKARATSRRGDHQPPRGLASRARCHRGDRLR
jgi:hypothetical protein